MPELTHSGAAAIAPAWLKGAPARQDKWSPPPDGGLERAHPRSPPGLFDLGTVRGAPDHVAGECAYAEARRAQGGPRWAGAAGGPGARRAGRAHDGGVLRHALGPRAPLSVPRRSRSRRI